MSIEGQSPQCIDCGTEIGNGVRCSECTIDCRKCGADFKTKADRNNHEHDGHCSACGEYLGDRPDASPRRVSHRTEDVHERPHFVLDGAAYFRHPVTGLKMKGGYLCPNCTQDDLTIL